jgi:hypothetical protein
VLPEDQRERCFFSTHFYRACAALSGYFRLATVRDGSETPEVSRELIHLSLESSSKKMEIPSYEGWLARQLRAGDWSKIHALNQAVKVVEAGKAPQGALPDDSELLSVLWERVGASIAPLLLGHPSALSQLLAQLGGAEARKLAEAVLLHGSPAVACGEELDAATECIAALKRAAGGAAWKGWSLRWKEDPLLQDRAESASGPKWAWWRR